MINESNQDGAVADNDGGEGTQEDVVTLQKGEYAKLNETIGSLKRDLKDLKKAKEETPEKTEKKADDELLKRLDSLALKTAGITESDEKELYEKWRTDTGRQPEAILENSIFKKELEDLKVARKNLAATSDIKGETGISEAKANPDYWISRSSKDANGHPVFPDDMPREMFTKVLDKLNPKSQGTKLRFYNSK